jgi:hypothetical protein
MDRTQNHELPYMLGSQADKHVTFNEAMLCLDTRIHPSWKASGTQPPSAPVEGDCFLVPAGAQAAWAGAEGKLASWIDADWHFTVPKQGWIGWNQTLKSMQVLGPNGWESMVSQNDLGSGAIARLGVGASPSPSEALAVAGDVFFKPVNSAAEAVVDVKLNRNAASGGARLTFSTGWSARAQLGLTANGGFGFKVSSNGTQWTDAIQIGGDGKIGLNANPTAAGLTLPGLLAIRGIGATYDTSLGLDTGALVIQSSQTNLAGFRLLPFFSDIHFQNTNSSGNIVFSGGFGSALSGNIIARTTGRMAVGDIAPTCKLDVDGPLRTRAISFAQLPSPSSAGAGAIVMISDEALGAVLAFSDGSNWRRVTDRAIVSAA